MEQKHYCKHPECRKEIILKVYWKLFCSDKCRLDYNNRVIKLKPTTMANCPNCNHKFKVEENLYVPDSKN